MDNKKEWVSDEEIDSLINGVTDKSVRLLTELLNGPYVGIDPLTEIPDSQMTIYEVNGMFFDTYNEALIYAKGKNIDSNLIVTFDYLGTVAGRDGVIRRTDIEGKTELLVNCVGESYDIYDNERSIHQGKYVWKHFRGSLKSIYDAFKNKGLVFKKDTEQKSQSLSKSIERCLAIPKHDIEDDGK